MASAKRLMELRQPCLNSSRMAEISVPAWPMPIHQTKLMMAKPQATGCEMAQMPTPLRKSQVSATSSTVAPPPAKVNSANQPIGVCGVSTMRAIFSVMDRKVCPGAITRYSPVAGSTQWPGGFTSLVAIGRLFLFPRSLGPFRGPRRAIFARWGGLVPASIPWPARVPPAVFEFLVQIQETTKYCVRGRVFMSAITW